MNKRKYVFVIWDPLYERVICVHNKLEDTCKKCERIRKKRGGVYSLKTKKFFSKINMEINKEMFEKMIGYEQE